MEHFEFEQRFFLTINIKKPNGKKLEKVTQIRKFQSCTLYALKGIALRKSMKNRRGPLGGSE